MKHYSSQSIIETLIHVIVWLGVFAFPLLVMMHGEDFAAIWKDYLYHGIILPISFLFVFYINFCIIIPRYLFDGHTNKYLFFNLLLVLFFALLVHVWHENVLGILDVKSRPMFPPKWALFLRSFFSMSLIVGLCTAIKLSGRWAQVEALRRESEKSRTEAELKNLINQFNPHFLLNTLNNIYALIAFDSDKAQWAVKELSSLLRHVLYNNQQSLVPLCNEMEFIRNYIELMRIRLTPNVTVETCFDIEANSCTHVAPLIFISLIENAFKHGISASYPSYINISFGETPEKIYCEVRNSFHPKTNSDKSGSGIGLEQVSKRLEYSYAGHYEWVYGVNENGKEYKSVLTIKKQ